LVTVSPETFAEQMEYLAKAGYRTLSADEFLDFLRGQKKTPPHSVLITFDDGFLDNYVHAYPVLRQHRQRAVIFAVTGWIGDGPPRACADKSGNSSLPATPDHRACKTAIEAGRTDEVMLRWSEIDLMESSGVMEIHSHTHSHIRWDKQFGDPAARLAAVTEDLQRSQATLSSRLKRTSRHLCWPWGYTEPGYSAAAEAAGFAAEYLTAKGINTPGADPRRIARIVVKDKAGAWFATRLWLWSRPKLGRLYTGFRRG
jgi:peptidoglycan/xylan/chitin deacetylase (PgdA/CDA1 family)